MYQCNETPLVIGRELGHGGCDHKEKHCQAKELGHGVHDAIAGLHEIEIGIKDVEYQYLCEGTQEVRHGLVKVDKAIDELLAGLGSIDNGEGGCHHCEGFDEFAFGVREIRHGAACCCEGLGELARPGCQGEVPASLRRGAGEIHLGLEHVGHALRQLLGFDFSGGLFGGILHL